MALIRGFMGLCPCPICLCPKDELGNLDVRYRLRTAKETQTIIQEADEADTAGEAEQILKSQSLRNVDVCKMIIFYIFVRVLTY